MSESLAPAPSEGSWPGPLAFHGPGPHTGFSACPPSAGDWAAPRFLDKGLEWHLTLLCSHLLFRAWGLLPAGGLLGVTAQRGWGALQRGPRPRGWLLCGCL